MRFLTYKDLKAKGILYSAGHIRKLRQYPPGDPRRFPDPVKGLSAADIWDESAIDQYVARQIAIARHEPIKPQGDDEAAA